MLVYYLNKMMSAIMIMSLFFCLSCKKEAADTAIDYEWISLDYRVPVGNIDEEYVMAAQMKTFFHNMKFGFISAPFEAIDSPVSLFLKTVDSCKTFTDLSEQVDGRVIDVSFVSEELVFLITDKDFLYKSTNGGTTWSSLENDDIYPATGLATNKNGYLFVGCDHKKVMFSDDGGDSWIEQFSVKDPNYPLWVGFTLQFVGETSDTGYISFRDTLYVTADGGRSWNYYLTSDQFDTRNYIFLNSSIVYVSHLSSFYKSTDGGFTFSKITMVDNNYGTYPISSVRIISENEMYCYYPGASQWRSFDEFRTMEKMDFLSFQGSKYDYAIRTCKVYGPKSGYALAASGCLYRYYEGNE